MAQLYVLTLYNNYIIVDWVLHLHPIVMYLPHTNEMQLALVKHD
jgi:hypothetical protein